MLNPRGRIDHRHVLGGKDGVLLNSAGVILASVETFQSKVNFTNGDFSAAILKPEYFTESAKILDEALRAADTPQAKENVKFLQLGLEHARMTWRMHTARLENVNNPSPEAKAKFETCLRELMEFRNANEKAGISDMGRLTFYERQGFPRSKPLKK